MRAVFDTNVLVDYLNGVESTRKEIERFPARSISAISWAETMVVARGEEEKLEVENFLATFEVVDITLETTREAVGLRQKHRMRLPDALIWAAARCRQAVLVTRNTKDFPRDDPGVRIPYEL